MRTRKSGAALPALLGVSAMHFMLWRQEEHQIDRDI
jgi:hypothetical protein